MSKNYAYLTKQGRILKITDKEKTAQDYSLEGKYVETDIPFMHGNCPAVEVPDDGQSGLNSVIVYSPTSMKVSYGKYVRPIPVLAALYNSLLPTSPKSV